MSRILRNILRNMLGHAGMPLGRLWDSLRSTSVLRSCSTGRVAAGRVGTLGLGRSAPPRVVGVCRPMPLVAHGCLPLRHPLACVTPQPPLQVPWGSGPLSRCPHLRGLYP